MVLRRAGGCTVGGELGSGLGWSFVGGLIGIDGVCHRHRPVRTSAAQPRRRSSALRMYTETKTTNAMPATLLMAVPVP